MHTHTHTHTHIFVVQHAQMLVVRKEGKAHDQYNSFRSSFEILEAVGSEPHDDFEETEEDVSPLQRLEKQMSVMKTRLLLRNAMHQQMKNSMQKQMSDMRTSMQQQMSDMKSMQQQMSDMRTSMQQEIDKLQTNNIVLESRLSEIENQDFDLKNIIQV